jgi:hypothetical protein
MGNIAAQPDFLLSAARALVTHFGRRRAGFQLWEKSVRVAALLGRVVKIVAIGAIENL